MEGENGDEEFSSSSSEGDYRNRVPPRFLPRAAAAGSAASSTAPGEPTPSTSRGEGMPPNLKGPTTPVLPRLQSQGTPRDFKREKERLESFAGFPSGTVDVRQLAAAGFVYTRTDDIVRCAFCRVEVGRWEEGDNPIEEHKKWSKNCSFLNHMDVGNVPVDPLNPPPLPPLETVGHDECGIYNIKKTDSCPIIPSLEKLGIHKRYTPAHPNYSTLEARLESFNCWPIGLKLRPQELAEAGFFYTGLGDKTICFQCGGGLKDWAENDEPWREHALYFSKCGFVIHTKGRDFIAEVLGKRPATLTPEEIQALAIPEELSNVLQQRSSMSNASSSEASSPPSPISENEDPEEIKTTEGSKEHNSHLSRKDDARLCKICFSEEIGVAFLPCGHLVACVSCVTSLTTCAVCRKEFSATVRVFLS